MRVRFFCVVILAYFFLVALFAHAVDAPVKVLVPVTDAKGNVVESKAPDGNTYPVFRLASDSPLVHSVYQTLETSFAHQVIVLDRYARNLRLSEVATQPPPPDLTAPAYLLMSQEEGGFERHGFWLEDAKGQRELVPAGYVDLVVGAESVEDGNLEEIFSHELGHQILGELAGQLPAGQSRNMHQSMAITDDPPCQQLAVRPVRQQLAQQAGSHHLRRRLKEGARKQGTQSFERWVPHPSSGLCSKGGI